LGDVTCKNCGATLDNKWGICPNCQTPNNSDSNEKRARSFGLVITIIVVIVSLVGDLVTNNIMYVVILILLSVAVGITFWRKRKSKSSQGKLVIWREVIGDWTRPWRELPRNMKTALAFFLALWFFTWVNERLQLIPSINNFNSWASKIYFLLLCVMCLYFLKASWAYRGRHMQRGQSPAINSQSQQTDNHKAKQYPYA